MPNFIEFHRSVTAELKAVQNKIRNLVTHWATDGEWKEAAIRTVLRRHLPRNYFIGRGFVVDDSDFSTQIDLLILKPDQPTLFSDGDLAIVTPDVPSAIVEVKTEAVGSVAWEEIALKLARHGERCRADNSRLPWLGIFAYEGSETQLDNAIKAVAKANSQTGVHINCVCIGESYFIRYWHQDEQERGDGGPHNACWRGYRLENLAPSYFVGNCVDAICNIERHGVSSAWFAYADGKFAHRVVEVPDDY
jgi:hypothetical protein